MNESSLAARAVLRMKLKAGDLAYKQGDFQAAMTNYQSVRNQADKHGDHEILSLVLIKTAICLSALDRLSEAETLLHQAESIETSRHILDVDEAVLLHHELSILLFRLGRFEEGLKEEKIALEMFRAGNHIDDNLLVLVLKQLAVYMSRDQQFSVAISFLEDAMAVAANNTDIGKGSLLYGQLLITYALIKIDMKRIDEARELYDKGILLIQIALGENNPKVADVYNLLAHHLREVGCLIESEEFAQRASKIDRANRNNHAGWPR